ncbi:MAG: alpha/beta fold hydrolase [Bacteroidetes bacterium]|jgi:pimeloyl-ACP methyl ester carboxylesterase|nr:alpha/beta fold hydrolase [Bacteroidota bacterium]
MSVPFPIQERAGFRYVDEGPSSDRPPVVLLHGMLGDADNWTPTIHTLSEHGYRVIVPLLPVYDLPMKQTHVPGLVTYVHEFLEQLGIQYAAMIGNSLGGHVALLYTLKYSRNVAALVLTGSSGIYELEMGSGMMRRRDREFLRERAAMTFYDPSHATDELVDEVLDIVNDRSRALRLIKMARSAQAETVTEELPEIDRPTLLVWGRNDQITPPNVAEEFLHRLPSSTLRFIDQCGHAPMIEHPDTFNQITLDFLEHTIGAAELAPTTGS